VVFGDEPRAGVDRGVGLGRRIDLRAVARRHDDRFARDLARGDPGKAELLVDGADATTANQVLQKADALARAEGRRRAAAAGMSAAAPIEARAWTRYNPAARSAIFLVPGLTAYLMAIGAVLLTALTVAGEWERGSMEQLFASPVGRFEIILGKLLPYLALGMLQVLLVVAVGAVAFEVPIRGSLAVLFLFGLAFLAGMLGQGLLVSVLAKNQLVATQAAVLSSLLPSLLLSGMLFPIENMPRPLQLIASAIPARYLVHALRGILLKASGLDLLWPDLAALAIFAAAIGAAWHPLRLIPLAVLLALVAVGIGGRSARLATWAVIICAVCFFIGIAAAVITSHPLW
jgi:ABC-2 type transport system permease protein